MQHIPSLFCLLNCAMRINLAAILHVKIAWSHASKRLVSRTDTYKMVAATVLVNWSYGWCGLSVRAGNTTFFQTIYILCLCRACACNIPCGQSPRKYACGSQAVISTAQSGRLVMSVFSSWFSVFSSLHGMKLAILPTTTSHNAKSAGTAHNPINQRNLLHPKICNVACLRRGEVI